MKLQQETLLNKMKQIFFCFLMLFVINCKQSTKEATTDTNKKSETISIEKPNHQIDFLNIKYQKNGLSIPDDLNGDLYPSYSYFDKVIGTFSVNYIGKNYNIRNYWDINNPKGYFSISKNIPENAANNSMAIMQAINYNDYYFFVDYIPSKYIKYIDRDDEEFEIEDGARTKFYLYENSKWIQIGEVETKKIPERSLQYYLDIIQSHTKKFSETKKNSWNGIYNLKIDYGKLDEFSEMSIDYEIEITNGKCTFSGMGYKTDFTDLCKIEDNGDNLVLKYVKTIDGDGFTDHSEVNTLGVLFKKNNLYYIKSPIIANRNWDYNSELQMTKK